MDIKEINDIIEQLENKENRDTTEENALHIYKQKRNEYYDNIVKGVKYCDYTTAHRIN